MKVFKITLPILVFCVVAVMFFKLRFDRIEPAGVDGSVNSVAIQAPQAVPEDLLVSSAMESVDLVAESSTTDSVVNLQGIPDGEFKQGLLSLSQEIQNEVLAKMETQPQLLKDIDSIRVDPQGTIFYACSIGLQYHDHGSESSDHGLHVETTTAVEVIEMGGVAASVEDGSFIEYPIFSSSVSTSAPPVFHSRPGATNVLFLDFNGHEITGTAWNNSTNNPETWVCLPYDTDGIPEEFSVQEQEEMYLVWLRVAEDYAPFDVDITTEQPVAWTRTTGHALITPGKDANGFSCPHDGAGGVAYVGVFGGNNYSYDSLGACYSPAWVSSEFGVYNTAEIVSHELGHNMGLNHDGQGASEYYSGHDNGSVSWGPIMGTAAYKMMSQWSKGDYDQASNTSQDDLQVLAGKLSFIADDYQDTAELAAPVVFGIGGEAVMPGLIGHADDVDVFQLTIPTSQTVTAKVCVARIEANLWESNLDALLEIRDSNNNLMAMDNEELLPSAALETPLQAGTYYLYVIPQGVGNPLDSPPTGYTSYGSVGNYELRVSADVSETASHTIVASSGSNGEISPFGDVTVYEGQNQTFTFTPDAGYRVKDVFVNSHWVENIDGTEYTFTNVTQGATIYVTFVEALSAKYEAEDATFDANSSISVTHAGYSGTGFVDMGGSGSYIEQANVDLNGLCVISVTYALGSSSRPCDLYIGDTLVGTYQMSSTQGWTNWLTKAITIDSVEPGSYTIKLVAQGSGGPNVDFFDVEWSPTNSPPPTVSTTTYEAETFTLESGGCVVATNKTGYSGDGFTDMAGEGSYFVLTNIAGEGAAEISVAYALGKTTARPCELYIDDQLAGTYVMEFTESWTNWVAEPMNVILVGAGPHTLKLVAGANGGPNVDYFTVLTSGDNTGGNSVVRVTPSLVQGASNVLQLSVILGSGASATDYRPVISTTLVGASWNPVAHSATPDGTYAISDLSVASGDATNKLIYVKPAGNVGFYMIDNN